MESSSSAFSGLRDDGRQHIADFSADAMRLRGSDLPQQHHTQHYAYVPFPQHLEQHYAYPPTYTGEYGGPSSYVSDEDSGYVPTGQSPGAWSSQTDSSGVSSPPSDAAPDGSNEWDLLSDMLMNDALPSNAASSLMAASSGGYPTTQHAISKTQHMMQLPAPQQYHYGGVQHLPLTDTMPVTIPATRRVRGNGFPASGESPDAGYNASQVVPSSPPEQVVLPYAQTTAASSLQAANSNISPSQRARAAPATTSTSAAANRKAAAQNASGAVSGAGKAMKAEPISLEEQKKLRRRTQIASSVQRHREKKKNLVSTLKDDLAALTRQLESMRSQRKSMHAQDDEGMVEWEERAITQRRKRRQCEDVNARLKKALFQQTSFLFGMRAMMNDLPAPREFEFHDWIHSYTVLSARDPAHRRKEYASFFSESKMDLAAKILLRDTDRFMAYLDPSRPYYANVRLLHDGSRTFVDEDQVVVRHELRRDEGSGLIDVGNGQVMKKYTSIFLYEDREDLSFDALHEIAWESTKQVGVFWPGAGYSSQIQDSVAIDENSRVYFNDLSASMDVIDDVQDGTTVTVESRMLCREQKCSETGESIVVWDYVDKDDLYPLPVGEAALRRKTITRKSCGVFVVRKEPNGFMSMRSTSIKIFDTSMLPEASCDADMETIASMNRRLGLQATEAERGQQKCIKYVYNAINAAVIAATTNAN